MLLYVYFVQHGSLAVQYAVEMFRHPKPREIALRIVERLIFQGNATYATCKNNHIVQEALKKGRKVIAASLDSGLPVPDLCAVVAEYF